MSLKHVLDEWDKDSQIDRSDLGVALLNVNRLHHKYLKTHSFFRQQLSKEKTTKDELYNLLEMYYNGTIDQANLKALNRNPYGGIIKSQKNVENHINRDPEMIGMVEQIGETELILQTLESILKAINNSGFHIQGAIEWYKLTKFSG